MKRIEEIFRNKNIMGFLISMLIFGMASGFYQGSFNNYMAEVQGISPFERGIAEFVRELPGLFLIFILALLYRVSEAKLVRLALLISMLGMSGLALNTGGTKIAAVGMITIFSLGEHIVLPLRDSISIHNAKSGKSGLAIGLTRSFSNAGMIAGFYSVSLIFFLARRVFHVETPVTVYRIVFVGAALTCLAGVIFTSRLEDSSNHIKRPKFVLKKKFSKYYILEIFSGARKQVFITFAPYVLIVNYGAPTELIAVLYGIYSLANLFMNPLMGKLVDRIGYRLILVLDYSILVLLCLVYGFSHHIFGFAAAYIVVCIVFVLDAMLFSAGIARAVYVESLSSGKDEMTATLTTGVSINHLVSVIIALLGGWIWQTLGIETLFSIAALFGFTGVAFSLLLEREKAVKTA